MKLDTPTGKDCHHLLGLLSRNRMSHLLTPYLWFLLIFLPETLKLKCIFQLCGNLAPPPPPSVGDLEHNPVAAVAKQPLHFPFVLVFVLINEEDVHLHSD